MVIPPQKTYFGSSKQNQQHQPSQRYQDPSSLPVRVSATVHIYPYKVESFQHFGTITCNAQNAIGQSGPCLYHIMAAEIPDPVKNCTASNSSANSIQISCQPGRDGGIQQYFHIEIYDEQTRTVMYNASYKSSEFVLKRLPSDSVFRIKVTAYNLQGASSPFRLRSKTLPAPLLRTGMSQCSCCNETFVCTQWDFFFSLSLINSCFSSINPTAGCVGGSGCHIIPGCHLYCYFREIPQQSKCHINRFSLRPC